MSDKRQWEIDEFIECGCHGHRLQLYSDSDMHGEAWLAMWYPGTGHKEDFLSRIKTAWRVLVHGEMFCDQFIVTPRAMGRVIEFFERIPGDEDEEDEA